MVHTTCPMDCPDTCVLEALLEENGAVRLLGRKDQPITQGIICTKTARFNHRLHHPLRIMYPMVRIGPRGSGQFRRVSWDEAINILAQKIHQTTEQYGSESIVGFHYGGSNGWMTDDFLDHLFFARIGASRLAKTYCAAPTGAVAKWMYGKMPGVAYEDFIYARIILLWGANPKYSSIHLMPFLRKARVFGAKIVVIDPVLRFSEREIDLHLPILPGTDLPLALAMIRWFRYHGFIDEEFLARHATNPGQLLAAAELWPLERAAKVAGVPLEKIEQVTEWYATITPALIRCGWGLERNRNGARAAAAILAIPALLNKFGTRGGGYTMSNSGAVGLVKNRPPWNTPWNTRVLNMSQVASWLNDDLDPPVRLFFVYNANPVVTAPNQTKVIRGLKRKEVWTVVHDQVMTDTAQLADMVLPATTFLEHYDVKRSYGHYVIGGVIPVIPPIGESRANYELFAALGRALGLRDELFSLRPEELFRYILDAIQNIPNLDPEAMMMGNHYPISFKSETPIQFVTVFPRPPERKINIVPEGLGPEPYTFQPNEDLIHTLALVSPSSPFTISSTMGEYNFDELYVEVNPADAKIRGIENGVWVRVFNNLGEVVARARLTDRVRPGVLCMPKGAWLSASRNGFTATALAPDHVDPVAGGACYNDARVELQPIDRDNGESNGY